LFVLVRYVFVMWLRYLAARPAGTYGARAGRGLSGTGTGRVGDRPFVAQAACLHTDNCRDAYSFAKSCSPRLYPCYRDPCEGVAGAQQAGCKKCLSDQVCRWFIGKQAFFLAEPMTLSRLRVLHQSLQYAYANHLCRLLVKDEAVCLTGLGNTRCLLCAEIPEQQVPGAKSCR
jgi:hypothetical protein